MRRILSVGLIVAASWLLAQGLAPFVGADMGSVSPMILAASGNSDFLIPVLGALMGLVGGVTMFLGGSGGGIIALAGGVTAAAYGLATGQSYDIPGVEFWENEAVVGLGLLMMAATALVAPPVDA